MASSSSILRQLSGKEGWNSTSSSKRWSSSNKFGGGGGGGGGGGSGSGNVGEKSLKQMEGFNGGGYNNFCGGGMVMRKRVMVVVDQSSSSKHAMMWALTHVTNKGDLLTLLHIIPPQTHHNSDNSHERFSSPSNLAHSLGSLCKASKPEVEVEALVVQGPKLATVMNQVKKLEVSVLVLGQKKPSLISCFCGSSSEVFVEHCINNAECLTLGVRRQSQGMGGYLISSRWQKNFWLLA